MLAASTVVYINLIDAQGYDRGRSIPVEIAYIDTVEKSYGEDADGARGTVLASREIIDLSIAHEHLITMNSADVEYCLDEARHIFAGRY